MKKVLLIALFPLCALLSFFSFANAHALAPVDALTIPVGWETFVDAHMGSNIPSNWRDLNYALIQYDTDPSTFIIIVGDDTQFAMSDGGTGMTGFTGHSLCRWNTDLTGGPGCNPPGSTSISTSKVYKLHLTDAKQVTLNTDWPAGYTAYTDLFNPKQIIKPDFTYAANGKDVTAKDFNQTLPAVTPDAGYTIQGYSVEWSLFKCATWTDVGNICGGTADLVDHKIQDQNQQYAYTVSDLSDYTLSAQYLVQECYRYPSYPATPDNCFYVSLSAELPTYNFTTTTVHLKIDGSAIAGDTAGATCDVSGFCTPPSPYKDCSTFGLDVGGYVGCIVGNFQVWLTALMTTLFVPGGSFFAGYWANFSGFLATKLGFIWGAIASVMSLFTGIITAAGSESCTTGSLGTFFGTSVSFDFCSLQDISSAGWTLISTLIRSITVLAMVFAFYRKYHEVVDAR
jgi:hypothetical protein